MSANRRFPWAIVLAAAATLPGLLAAVAGWQGSPLAVTVLAGSAIMAASFLLLWACDAAQADVSQALALAAVAFVAVLPEYAVDMYFTWQAGQHPEGQYAHYSIANMTGANRLIVGVAWAAVAVVFWLKTRASVKLGSGYRTEIGFLGVATLYALVIRAKGSLTWIDGLVLLAIYGWYVVQASRRPVTEGEAEGPAALIVALPKVRRRVTTLLLFAYAAAVIGCNAARFSEGLVATGRLFHINEFLLVQWLAPIASESPEFIVAIMFALRSDADMALGSLLSSKLNQWTLLVGMIPLTYAVSAGTLAHPLPMSAFQMQEILLTAAQALLAVVVLSTLELSVAQAGLLFALFIGQLVAPQALSNGAVLGIPSGQLHTAFSLLYLFSAIVLLIDRPERLTGLWLAGKVPFRGTQAGDTPRCRTCRFRLAATAGGCECPTGE